MMNKDSIYVLKQPTHSLVSLIVVEGDELPLDKVVHEKIDKLGSISDLVFIFSDRFKNGVDIKKFANLYRGCAYIHGSSGVISKPLLFSLEYCFNVFQKHIVYLFTSINRLGNDFVLGKEELLNIQEFSLSSTKKPILEAERLSYEELSEIYMLSGSWKDRFKVTQNYDRLYSTMKSPTPIMFFKKEVIGTMLRLMPDDVKFLDSFIESDYSCFLVSLLDKLGIDIISKNILKIKVGSIKNG